MPSTRFALNLALLAVVGIACGPAASPAEPATSDAESNGPAAASPTPESSGASEAATVEASDPAADCFNGFKEPIEDCAGLDLIALVVGPAASAPAFAVAAATEDRIALTVTFADDLAQVEEFGICFHMNLDGDDATGYDDIDMPGLERVICAGPPEGFVAWYERGALGYDADPVEDQAMVTYFVEGNRLVVAVHPSLLTVDPGAAPDGFVLYVGTARSINALDYFNGEGPLHVPVALVVPDDVVSQVD
ncbi:MAG: hypothetical protein ACRDG5_10490 [Anaerolineales bacterium]